MKPADSPREWLKLDSPQAAKVLTDPQTQRFLTPFLGLERKVSEVAAELGVQVNSVLYRVRQFLRLGMLEVVRVERRKGRPVKVYRATAKGFFAPFVLTDAESLETLGLKISRRSQGLLEGAARKAWLSEMRAEENWGVRLFKREDGRVEFDVAPESSGWGDYSYSEHMLEPSSPAAWDQFFYLALNHQTAKELQLELSRILPRYLEKSGADGPTYLVRLAMAPLEP